MYDVIREKEYMLKLCFVLTVNKVTVVLRKRVYVRVVLNYAV